MMFRPIDSGSCSDSPEVKTTKDKFNLALFCMLKNLTAIGGSARVAKQKKY